MLNLEAFRHIEDIVRVIRSGRALIVSVSPGLRGGDVDEEGIAIKKGGHLILAFGCRLGRTRSVEAVLVHDPDHWPEYERRAGYVTIDRFMNSWSGRCITCGPRMM